MVRFLRGYSGGTSRTTWHETRLCRLTWGSTYYPGIDRGEHKMEVFVTGGAGFIGSHVCERLLRDGHVVRILDDLSTGSMANIDHLIGHEHFDYRIGCVTDAPLVAELVDRCDVTVHLAAAVGVRMIVEQPVRTIETNVHGTEVVLGAVAGKNKPVLIA